MPGTCNAPGGGRSLEGERVPSTAGQNQVVDRVTKPDVENDQRKSIPFTGRFSTGENIIG